MIFQGWMVQGAKENFCYFYFQFSKFDKRLSTVLKWGGGYIERGKGHLVTPHPIDPSCATELFLFRTLSLKSYQRLKKCLPVVHHF